MRRIRFGRFGTPKYIPCIPVIFLAGLVWAADVIPPTVRRQVEAQYTGKARSKHVQGDCSLNLVVGADGRPEPASIKVYRGIGYGLDENAVKAVRLWLFNPATKDGQAVRYAVRVEVKFRLAGSSDLPEGHATEK